MLNLWNMVFIFINIGEESILHKVNELFLLR